jgi:hypothetical protein
VKATVLVRRTGSADTDGMAIRRRTDDGSLSHAKIMCKTQSPTAPGGRFAKDLFAIDLVGATVTCPAGQQVPLTAVADGQIEPRQTAPGPLTVSESPFAAGACPSAAPQHRRPSIIGPATPARQSVTSRTRPHETRSTPDS